MKGVLLIHTGMPASVSPEAIADFQKMIEKDPFLIENPNEIPDFTKYEVTTEGINRFEKASSELAEKLENRVLVTVQSATRYNRNSIQNALDNLIQQGVKRLLVFPYYPFCVNSANSVSRGIIQEFWEINDTDGRRINTEFFVGFHDEEKYIELIREQLHKMIATEQPEHIVFSYHGVPGYYTAKRDSINNKCSWDGKCCDSDSDETSDCYKRNCFKASEAIAAQLSLGDENYTTAFHSRLGLEPWLFPNTLKTVEKLAKSGVKKIAFCCPGIAISGLESDSIVRAAETAFLEAGGLDFVIVPPLDADDKLMDLLTFGIDRWLIIDPEKFVAKDLGLWD